MEHRRYAPLLIALLTLAAGGRLAAACDIDVRENGFVTGQGMPYMLREYVLYLLDRKAAPELKARAERLQKLCNEKLSLTNLMVETAALDELSEENVKELKSDGLDLEKLPVTLLVGGSGTVMTAPGLPGEALPRALVASPKKSELKKLLSDTGNYCVLVFVPGGEAAADAAAMARIKAALAAHKKEYPTQEMPVLRVERTDPKEAFFLSEFGVTLAAGVPAAPALPVRVKPEKDEAGGPALAIVFGKGRVLLSPFTGEAITPENLAKSFAYLNHNASDCTIDAVFVNEDTFDLLMHWEPAVENKMLTALEEAGIALYNPWSEVTFDASGQPVKPGSETAAPETPAAPAPAVMTKSPLLAYALPALGGVLLIVVVGGWLILRKREPA